MRRKWALHGVSSDQVLQMPITGRPSKTWSGRPWFFIQLRWMKPSRSAGPNHAALRKVPGLTTDMGGSWAIGMMAEPGRKTAPGARPGAAGVGHAAEQRNAARR